VILKSRSKRSCCADGSSVFCYGVCEVIFSGEFADIEVFRCKRLVFEVGHVILVLHPSDSDGVGGSALG